MFQDRYTARLEEQLFTHWDAFDCGEDNYSATIAFLNDSNSFHSFGDALISFMQESTPELSSKNAIRRANLERFIEENIR